MPQTYSIKTVANLTKVNSHTIRAWERRYNALDPMRSGTGRRMYSSEDLDRLRLLAALVQKGHQISNIATLANTVLEAMLQSPVQQQVAVASPPQSEVCKLVLTRCLSALKNYELAYINSELESARFVLTSQQFVLDVILPMLAEVGRLVLNGEFTMAQEHALSAILRFQLKQIFYQLRHTITVRSHTRKDQVKGLSMTLTTQEGDFHEFGILSAAVLIATRGHIPNYLGASLPAKPFAEAAQAMGSDIVVIGSSQLALERLKTTPSKYLEELDQYLAPGTTIWWGGWTKFESKILPSGRSLKVMPSMKEFDAYLSTLSP